MNYFDYAFTDASDNSFYNCKICHSTIYLEDRQQHLKEIHNIPRETKMKQKPLLTWIEKLILFFKPMIVDVQEEAVVYYKIVGNKTCVYDIKIKVE
jgi:hypothetical protein